MGRLSFLFAGVIIFILISVDAVGQSKRTETSLDEDWRFHFGHASEPARDFNFTIAPVFSKSGKAENTAIDAKFDDGNWRHLDLPHDWAVELPFVNSENFDVMAHGYKPVGGLFPETSIGWYRKKFSVARADSGRHFSIRFDGVFRDARVWLNGFYLGRNESGYIGVSYDITDFVNFDAPNVLVVRVDATQYEGWFYEGAGIYRHVWLNVHSTLHIPDGGVFSYSEVDGTVATVFAQTTIRNAGQSGEKFKLVTSLVNRNGKTVAKTESAVTTLDPGTQKSITQALEVKNPLLWSVDKPYLYKLVSTLKRGQIPEDEIITRVGIRTIEVTAERGVILNGTPIKIQGVNCHQDHAGVGSALPDRLQYYRISLLKELGVNAYRASHNPPTPELLDACDSLGMLVMDETRLLNSTPEYMDQFERLIIRDRNHPSVFMWSIGNEEGYIQRNSVGKRNALTMLAAQRRLDPTRTATYAADLGNEFNGISEVIPVRGFNYREKFVIPYHNDHPEQPVVGTEMGSTVTTRGVYAIDSAKGYMPDQDIHAPWWASTAEAWWPIAAGNQWMLGGFVWTGFDYRGEPTPFKWPNINSHFGIMDMCGFPKNIYYYYQSWWTDKDVIHISPHWNWAGQEGTVIDVWVNSNADEVELFLNGASLGKKQMARNSHLKWPVAYRTGKLEAVGHKDGREIRTSVETTGPAKAIILAPDRHAIRADGKDVSVINVTVQDEKGRAVPDASDLISFVISGPGKIIGTGNGDPSSHAADKPGHQTGSRKLFSGKCQLIVQAGKTVGIIRIEARSGDLTHAILEIECENGVLKL